ncbi:lysophospholipid acyltransferase family protein [Marinimicrobium alkaliphilum]|uniref:lysophospholipid acyltransferase family protein n=1 Tax=Marinimicrobium alkaliphilum TaxID=2202654 RepID=UPI000DB981F1|nr:lysophospholipid acyltransferase family protein [Marinimicrobium alkaliphilum]
MFLSRCLVFLVRLLMGATPRWLGCEPHPRQRIYFANHTSHIDTLAIWSALPPALRKHTHAVAAADYWGKTALRRSIALKGLNAVLVERQPGQGGNPLTPLIDTLKQGDSLIIFPEGTRRPQRLPGEFKSGLFRLAQQFPDAELIPVYLENLHRCMPKGALLPVPLICTVRFGEPLGRLPEEHKDAFLARARQAVEELA